MNPYQPKEEDYSKFKPLYDSMMKGEKEKVMQWISQYAAISEDPWRTLTVCDDTVLHMAVYMGHENIARDILEKHTNSTTLKAQNAFGDTILHEAAATNMIDFVNDLLKKTPELLYVTNKDGETPLFRAAHFGQTKMFILLCNEVDKILERNEKLKHMRRKDGITILHMAILAEHFDLALLIARRYPDLVNAQDENKFIGLQLLSDKPSAFKSGCNHGYLKSFLYYCVPNNVEDKEDKNHQANDADIYTLNDAYQDNINGNLRRSPRLPPTYAVCEDLYFMIMLVVTSALRKLNLLIWRLLCQGWPVMEGTWNEKRKHEAAIRLAKLLIRADISWELSNTSEDKGKISVVVSQHQTEDHEVKEEDKMENLQTIPREVILEEQRGKYKKEKRKAKTSKSEKQLTKTSTSKDIGDKGKEETKTPPTSLLIATRNGIVEIVKEILAVYPQVVEHISNKGQNILHVAIKYRQKEIFSLVRKMEIPMARLVRRIDNNGYTILHHVAVMGYYSGGTLPGPALQLQEELHWFERVQKIIPPHYAMHRSNRWGRNETAQEFFQRRHEELLKEAQEWLKRTSESCSTVAVLIATVAFAAAYTVPGGSNQDTGLPILLHDPFFLVFTVMDVLSLASSLTSVVMFLSILTSPFQLQDFRHSLPRKLTLGFTFLFFSVAATMLAFAATILLIIHLKKRWTRLLIYSVAFFPVTIFALLQFPLYLAFMGTLKTSIRAIKKAFPWHFIPRLFKTNASSIGKVL